MKPSPLSGTRSLIYGIVSFLAILATSDLSAQIVIRNPFKKDTTKKPPPALFPASKSLPDQLEFWAHLINSVADFEKAVKNISQMNSKDFGKHVNVVKVEPGNQQTAANIPPKDITKPVIKKGEFTNLYWEPVAYFNNQLFPSAVISLAGYKGVSKDTLFEAIRRPLGFRVYSRKNNIPLRWEIECIDKSYFDKVGGSFLYTTVPGREMSLFNADSIPWNYKALMNTKSPTPVNFYFRLFDENGQKVEKMVTLTIRSVNDCVTGYHDEDLTELFSAYVQEDDLTKIDAILREGVNTKIVGQFVGYQFNGSYGSSFVDLQVAAIWRALHERGFTYTSIADNSAINSEVAFSQTVRTFDNSLSTSQANCVDGTVVFASILKKIGIRTVLVAVPGHCFLGYYVNADENNLAIHYLETTMLSDETYLSKDSVNNNSKFIEQVFPKVNMKTASMTNKEYLLEFIAARLQGEINWKRYNDKYPAAQYPTAVRRIDVNEQRKWFQPLPFYD